MYTRESFKEVVARFHKVTLFDYIVNVIPVLHELLETLKPEDEILAGTLNTFSSYGGGILLILRDRIVFRNKVRGKIFGFGVNIGVQQHELYLNNVASLDCSYSEIISQKYASISICDAGGKKYNFSMIFEDDAEKIMQALKEVIKI